MGHVIQPPLGLYETALADGRRIVLRDAAGAAVRLDIPRWRAHADRSDERVLARAAGPVLDVGCGPGRHARALARRGVPVLGVDVSRRAVALAAHGGARIHHGSVFAPVPGAGDYRTALLLDGNVGIGGDPVRLLQRVGTLLSGGGRVLCETGAPGGGVTAGRARLEYAGTVSDPFPWARVAADALAPVAGAAGFALADVWQDGGRWFSELVKRARPARRAA